VSRLNCVANGRICATALSETSGYRPARERGRRSGRGPVRLPCFAANHASFQVRRIPCRRLSWPRLPPDRNETRLQAAGARFHVLDDESLLSTCAEELISGAAAGLVFKEEWTARERWARAPSSPTARSTKTQSLLNLKVIPESFRPGSLSSVLRERVADWFELDGDSPYMLLVAKRGARIIGIPMTPRRRLCSELTS